jgi:CheY-like chemotaxis protein/MinD-like ATPase involved in chromosome partitioning or flagellar assembly
MKLVLVVDDDANVRKLLDFALQQAGFSVLTAASGNEGLRLAEEHHPDVAVLDVMMPGVHGYELCRRLRADPNTADAKVVFLTARSQPIDEQEALKAGGDLFLSKPVMPEDLVRHIQSLLLEKRATVPEEPQPSPPPPPRRQETPAAPQRAEERKGRMIACYSPTPNVGVTSLSVNLALGLTVSLHIEVPLVELHSVQSDTLAALDIEPEPHRGNLGATGQSVTWDTLVLHLIDHPSGLRVLPAPPANSEVPAALTAQAAALLRKRFPVTVYDAATRLDPRVKPVILSADVILMVTAPQVAAVREMLQATQALRKLGYSEKRILLVVNNISAAPEIPVEQLAHGIKRPIFAVIPHEPALPSSLQLGRPLLIAQPGSPASQAIGRITMQLVRGLKLTAAAR